MKTKWRALLDREREQRRRLHEIAQAGGKQDHVEVREWWGTISEVLAGVKDVTHLDDLPLAVFATLSGQAAYLAVGQIPDTIKDVSGKGRTAPGPGETTDIRWAVTYIQAVRDGLVLGREPVALVRRLYKLRNELTVRTWCRKYDPFPYPEAWVVSSLRDFLISAARRYRNANTRSWAASVRKRKSK